MQPSNPIFDQYSKPVLLGNGITFTILPIIVVGLRLYARRVVRVNIGLDDWCIVFALVLCTTCGIVEILATELGGLGQHQRLGPNDELIHTPELTRYEKCRYINELITTLNLGVVKISILLFYRRLFTVRPFKVANTLMIVLVASWAISFSSAMAAQCSPPNYFWEAFEVDYEGHCIQVFKMYEGLAWSDLFLDILVLSFPIPIVASLHLSWRAKIKVLDILLLGAVVLASGIARLVTFMQVVNYGSHHAMEFSKDSSYATGGPLFWIFAENAIAIIGACLPTLAPLWSDRFSHSQSSTSTKKPWTKSKPRSYDDLDGPWQGTKNGDDASIRHLVYAGPATNITTNDIALDDRPQQGIHVLTTLNSDYNRRNNVGSV